MDSRLLVPATPALLEGWCGPVLAHVYDKPEPCVLIGPSVLELDDGTEVMDYALHVVDGETFDTAPVDDIALDLSRAECRDRVARVLAPPGLGAIAPRLVCEVAHTGGIWLVFLDEEGGNVVLDDEQPARWPWPVDLDRHPTDDTELPDGSRLVDALALAAVAREVLRA